MFNSAIAHGDSTKKCDRLRFNAYDIIKYKHTGTGRLEHVILLPFSCDINLQITSYQMNGLLTCYFWFKEKVYHSLYKDFDKDYSLFS